MIRGKVIHVGQMMEGVSKTKGTPWRKQEYVIETEGQYPTTVAFSLMNDRIAQAAIQMGNVLEVDADARSREYQGKWYTELIGWRVKNLSNGSGSKAPNFSQVYNTPAPQGYSAPQQVFIQPQQTADSFGTPANSDMPF